MKGIAPHERVYQEWFARRAPTLCKHIANNGRQAKMVQAARVFAEKAGLKALRYAMQVAEAIWKTLDDGEDVEALALEILGSPLSTEEDKCAAGILLDALGLDGPPVTC
ncbi:hypothetical protein HF668_15525 [Acidithiobacillus ferridurans]|nr:hypothetical protein [Acidithiobacillus ferridurans]